MYLDTNIFSRITDLRISLETATAYRQLADVQGLTLVTSAKTKQEMERTSDKARASMLLFLFSVFSKVPWQITEHSGAFNTTAFNMCAFNSSWIHPTLVKFRTIFEPDDADHVFQAAQAGCHYFLTLDVKTILSKSVEHQASLDVLCPQLRFRSPIQLVSELTENA
ncbi:MAG: hypothetical protein NTV14_10610 [Coprothermobacterota bacterium]|nr:hypothetical protein [Coprothermobacterota bacterium]